jgi:hypothetical protein
MTSVFQDFDQTDSKTLKFRLSPVSVSYANSLRRSVQTEVSTLGFRADMTDTGSTSDVKIFKNSTPMSNEMLADRVGLLPIAMTNVSGWEKESVLFKLHVKNDTDEVRLVTASDFECLENQPTSEERVRVPNTRFFHPDRLEKASVWMRKYGVAKAVFIARFIPVVRHLVNPIAGMIKMPYKKFFFWNVISAIVWTESFIWGGYFLGEKLKGSVDKYVLPIVAAIVLVSVAPIAHEMWKGYKERKAKKSE